MSYWPKSADTPKRLRPYVDFRGHGYADCPYNCTSWAEFWEIRWGDAKWLLWHVQSEARVRRAQEGIGVEEFSPPTPVLF